MHKQHNLFDNPKANYSIKLKNITLPHTIKGLKLFDVSLKKKKDPNDPTTFLRSIDTVIPIDYPLGWYPKDFASKFLSVIFLGGLISIALIEKPKITNNKKTARIVETIKQAHGNKIKTATTVVSIDKGNRREITIEAAIDGTYKVKEFRIASPLLFTAKNWFALNKFCSTQDTVIVIADSPANKALLKKRLAVFKHIGSAKIYWMNITGSNTVLTQDRGVIYIKGDKK